MNKLQLSLLIALAALAGAAVYSSAVGQSANTLPAATRVAVCDVEDIFANYGRARDLMAKLSQEREAIEAESADRQRTVNSLRMELEQLKEDSPEYEQRVNEIQRLGIDREAWLQLKQASTLRQHSRLTGQMYGEINAAIEAVAKDNGVQIVLFKQRPDLRMRENRELLDQILARKVLYSDPGVDITQTVLARLNEQYRSQGQ